MTKPPTVRLATLNDIPAIQAIYAHHVLHGTATFEEEVPSVEEMAQRFHQLTDNGYPYIVAEIEGKVCAYAYLGRYRPRRAYRFTVENSIYIDKNFTGKGIGTLLLTELIRLAEQGPWHLIIAVIGDSENHASINLHQKLGFEMVGVEPGTGFKFGRWIDTVIMYKKINGGNTCLPTAG
ncbi:GNAT family N-acetyltransferase [Pelistega europaea]|uniref:N-acetyltransferase n=1 Tax=Pelistega europaea TaxID=106147 RepID=A0A7Y4LCM7_9BURK|nr:GNAT family N-acetyltransferase [Pelistega europaea]NOL49987.1 N-acetyltransferase [Pelistega europaea]